jgi:lysophospholipase L1-like esterase
MNEWIRGYEKEINAVYADYAAALTDAKGDVKSSLAQDEVHPTAQGYAAMRPVAEAAIR